MKKFNKIKHPTSYDKVRELKKTIERNKVYVDDTYACIWVWDNANVLCTIGVNNGKYNRLRGHWPDGIPDASWSVIQVNINELTQNASVYACYDEDDYRNIKKRLTKIEDLNEDQKRDWLAIRRIVSGCKIEDKKNPEYGVELELESEDIISNTIKDRLQNKHKDLIYDVGGDGSVYGGNEIRFRHPQMKGWKLNKIKEILDDAKEIGMKSEYGTAGMHIHISHPAIDKVVNKFSNHFIDMQNILYPISCRTQKIGKLKDRDAHYGLGGDIWRDQRRDFKTIELRVWKATTDPHVFLARLHIARALVRYLASDKPVSTEGFFQFINKNEKRDYKFLLNTENPHEFGFSAKVMNCMME